MERMTAKSYQKGEKMNPKEEIIAYLEREIEKNIIEEKRLQLEMGKKYDQLLEIGVSMREVMERPRRTMEQILQEMKVSGWTK